MRRKILAIIALSFAACFISCPNRAAIKIGFAGGLTGRLSDLGIAGRNGAILAVEEVNSKGGIKGRQVELITRDDKNDPDTALKVDKELIEEGAAAIIGHMTSAMSMAALPLINKEKIVMISPTTSTDELTGIDDYFFRVMPPNTGETDSIARYAFNERKVEKIAAVYDLSNRSYCEGFYQNFKDRFEQLGGSMLTPVMFHSSTGVNFSELTETVLKQNPDGLLIIASAQDTAMLCQQFGRKDIEARIFPCGWAMTEELINHGGASVEGLAFFHFYADTLKEESFLRFREKYKERFGSCPNFASVFAYEAARILFKVLSVDSRTENLKDGIINQKVFPGLHGEISIDQYGDCRRELFKITVKDGQFIVPE